MAQALVRDQDREESGRRSGHSINVELLTHKHTKSKYVSMNFDKTESASVSSEFHKNYDKFKFIICVWLIVIRQLRVKGRRIKTLGCLKLLITTSHRDCNN